MVSCVYNSNTMMRWKVETGDTVEACKPPVLMYSVVISTTNRVEGDDRYLSLFSGLCRCIITYMHLHSYMQTCTYIIHTRKDIFCSQDITCIILELKKVKKKKGRQMMVFYLFLHNSKADFGRMWWSQDLNPGTLFYPFGIEKRLQAQHIWWSRTLLLSSVSIPSFVYKAVIQRPPEHVGQQVGSVLTASKKKTQGK